MKQFMLVALSVLGLSIVAHPVAVHAQAKKTSAKTMTTTGTVKSVSGTSLVVNSKGKDETFTVDTTTKFTGKGLSTKSQGKTMASTDAVHEGDMVTVSYHDMNGTMHAATVRITNANPRTKK
jgi:hypothetical protein